MSMILYGYSPWTQTKPIEKRPHENYIRMLRAVSITFWKQYPSKSSCSEPTSYLTNYPSKTNKICRTLLGKQERTQKQYSFAD